MCLAGAKWKNHEIAVSIKKILSNTTLFLKTSSYSLWGWELTCRKYLFFILSVGTQYSHRALQ